MGVYAETAPLGSFGVIDVQAGANVSYSRARRRRRRAIEDELAAAKGLPSRHAAADDALNEIRMAESGATGARELAMLESAEQGRLYPKGTRARWEQETEARAQRQRDEDAAVTASIAAVRNPVAAGVLLGVTRRDSRTGEVSADIEIDDDRGMARVGSGQWEPIERLQARLERMARKDPYGTIKKLRSVGMEVEIVRPQVKLPKKPDVWKMAGNYAMMNPRTGEVKAISEDTAKAIRAAKLTVEGDVSWPVWELGAEGYRALQLNKRTNTLKIVQDPKYTGKSENVILESRDALGNKQSLLFDKKHPEKGTVPITGAVQMAVGESKQVTAWNGKPYLLTHGADGTWALAPFKLTKEQMKDWVKEKRPEIRLHSHTTRAHTDDDGNDVPAKTTFRMFEVGTRDGKAYAEELQINELGAPGGEPAPEQAAPEDTRPSVPDDDTVDAIGVGGLLGGDAPSKYSAMSIRLLKDHVRQNPTDTVAINVLRRVLAGLNERYRKAE